MSKKFLIATLVFLTYTTWWILLQLAFSENELSRGYFTDTYGVLALIGGVIGLLVSGKYGYFKSAVGASLGFFSLGLLSQFLGQLSYTVLFYVYGLENAYPSVGEIFYLASIPLYIIGILKIALASGVKLGGGSIASKLLAFMLPLGMVAGSYYFFLRNYDPTDLSGTIVFLDFVYPIGQAVFLSLAILTLILSAKVLGGVMKKKVVLILLSLVFQYIADSMFIYENGSGLWQPAGFSDILFLFSYFIMIWAMIQFDSVYDDLRKPQTN